MQQEHKHVQNIKGTLWLPCWEEIIGGKGENEESWRKAWSAILEVERGGVLEIYFEGIVSKISQQICNGIGKQRGDSPLEK